MKDKITLEEYCDFTGLSEEDVVDAAVRQYLHNQNIAKCQICGKLFSQHRRNEKYCDSPNPEFEGRSCWRMRDTIRAKKNRNKNEAALISSRIYNRVRGREGLDGPALIDFKTQNGIMKNKEYTEYLDWLRKKDVETRK